MGHHLATVLVFLLAGMAFVGAALAVGMFVRPRKRSLVKQTSYECGEKPYGQAWFNFNPRFYVVALIFIVFEVEVAFMIPVGLIYRDWVSRGVGGIAFLEMMIFALVLFVGLVYVWARGDLEWLKRDEEDR